MLEPLAPLRSEQQVVVRAGSFARAERRGNPLHAALVRADNTGSFSAR